MTNDTAVTPLSRAIADSTLSQRDLATKLDTGEAHVSRWVRGLHTPNRFYRREIVKALKAGGVETTTEELWPDA
jgi:ribosome-binding protein aMBF1 (putative translation factor)